MPYLCKNINVRFLYNMNVVLFQEGTLSVWDRLISVDDFSLVDVGYDKVSNNLFG